MTNPSLKMSHEGAARVRHFQPRVIIFQCRMNDRASYVLSYGQPPISEAAHSWSYNKSTCRHAQSPTGEL